MPSPGSALSWHCHYSSNSAVRFRTKVRQPRKKKRFFFVMSDQPSMGAAIMGIASSKERSKETDAESITQLPYKNCKVSFSVLGKFGVFE